MTEHQKAREWRERMGLTRAQLSEAIGYSPEAILWFEKGATPPNRNTKSGSSSREVKPWVFLRYKLACAGFAAQRAFNRTFEW